MVSAAKSVLDRANANTVYLETITGSRQAGWWGRPRFRGQLDILRLITRGLTRRRRGGSWTAAISPNTWARRRAQALGGKSRGPGERAPDPRHRVGEGEAVRIGRGRRGRVVQELAEGIVG